MSGHELIAGAVLAAPVLQDLAKRTLGPTADYVGQALAHLPVAAMANVEAVLSKVHRQVGDVRGQEQVPPRVLKAVWDDAQFADDELRQDYLAGVLASARSENGRDDRAAAHAKIVASLSTYALRTHYLLYAALQRHTVGAEPDMLHVGKFDRHLFVRTDEYCTGMAFSPDETAECGDLLFGAMRELIRFELAANEFISGDPSHLRERPPKVDYPAPGFIWSPSQEGAYFLATAAGVRHAVGQVWVSEADVFTLEAGPVLPSIRKSSSLPVYEGDDESA